MKKIALFLLFFVLAAQNVFTQNYLVPKDFILDKPEDFAKYEKDIINCINWLEDNPLNMDLILRKEVSSFLIKWMSGTPDVSIEIRAEIVNFYDENKDLLTLFVGGWTKFALENPAIKDDVVKGNVAGLKSAIKVYKKGISITKSPAMEKLVKIDEKNGLEQWVKKQLKMP